MDLLSGLGTHTTVQLDKQRIHLVERGTGPLVLLLHDSAGAWFAWRHQIPALASAGYRVVAIDMRGFGRSSKPADVAEYRITKLVDDCVGVVHALGQSEAVVVGHDLGAIVAWSAAWTRPDVFRGVAGICLPFGGRALIPIAGASTFGEVPPREAWRIVVDHDPDLLFYVEYRSIPGKVESDFEADVARHIRTMQFANSAAALPPGFTMPSPFDATPQEVLAFTRTTPVCIPRGATLLPRVVLPDRLPPFMADDIELFVAEFERTGLLGSLNYYRALDMSWEELAPFEGKPVEVPALFIGSTLDLSTIWGVDAIRRFPETLPMLTEVVMLDDCGHWVPRESPSATNEALIRFLQMAK